ncbi:hypothetical protein ACGC1H_003190 [Rhizoctonia solani]
MWRMLDIWVKCRHPNVVQLIGGAMLQTSIAAVYEWLEYGGVIEYLNHHPTTDRYKMSVQICEGVAYLHDGGIVHNSLKGTNILVSSTGVPQIHLSLLSSTNLVDGLDNKIPSPNIRWAAPELLLALSGGTFASDVYALGMTILETIATAVPYVDQREKHVVIKIMNRELPSRPRDAIPDNFAGNTLWNALCTCWSFEPVDRPSARQFLNAVSFKDAFSQSSAELTFQRRSQMHTVCNISGGIESDSIQSEESQHELSLVDAVALRLVMTEDTVSSSASVIFLSLLQSSTSAYTILLHTLRSATLRIIPIH